MDLYCGRAQELRQLAAGFPPGDARLELLRIAVSWEAMAERIARQVPLDELTPTLTHLREKFAR